jgi:CRP-like cAMP-binding protein
VRHQGHAQPRGDGQAAQERALSSFLETLEPDARDLLLSVARPVSFAAGATLVRHGESARGAFVLRAGAADAVVTLPGGESLTVATLDAGGMFGEMALIELGTCTATVIATAPVEGWFIAHEDFRALVSQCQPVALRLQHAVTVALADKLAALNAQLLACSADEDRPARAFVAGDPLAAAPRLPKPPFAAAAFLPHLPLFERFAADEVEELAARGSWVEAARGQAIFVAGEQACAAFAVVRGAVEVVAVRAGRERRVAVLGPGQLLGFLSVLGNAHHSTHAFARESALLLEFPGDVFRELYFGGSRASARLRHAVQASLLAAMARTNRALTRLISLAKLDASHRGDAGLEAAYHGQLTTAAH